MMIDPNCGYFNEERDDEYAPPYGECEECYRYDICLKAKMSEEKEIMLDLLKTENKISYGQLEVSPAKLTFISTDQQLIDDIKELVFLYNEYACADDEDLTEDGKAIKAAIWKLLRPWEGKERWGKCLGYTGTACPKCGRYRLELYENGKRVCEKCNWCVEDGTYRDVYAEEDDRMYDEYRKSYDICKEK